MGCIVEAHSVQGTLHRDLSTDVVPSNLDGPAQKKYLIFAFASFEDLQVLAEQS